MSPVMAAACAIVGKLTDVRKLAEYNATPRKDSPKPVYLEPEIDDRVNTDDDEREMIGDQSEDQGAQTNRVPFHGSSAGLPKF